MDSGTPNGNKSPQRRRGASTGAAQIVVLSDLQMPHMARVAEQPESRADSMLSDGISRAQLRASSKSISPAASSGSPIPLSTSRTTEQFRPFHYIHATRELPAVPPPSVWDESLTGFLARFCSPHSFGLESLSIWHDEMAKIKTPANMTREQWGESEPYIKYLAQQLAANNALTGNLNWAMFHYVVHMRCLKTVDFLGDIDPALRSLHFVLRIVLKGLCIALEADRLRKVLAGRPIASGTIDLIVDKQMAMENGEVCIHAFKQTFADPSKLYQQLLHYTVLAIAHVDIHRSQDQYVFYQDLIAMLLDLFATQLYVSGGVQESSNLFVQELVENIGPSNAFNVNSTQAKEITRSLLLNAIEAPSAPSAQGLVQTAYTYLFSRQSTLQSKQLEQLSLYLLLLLITTFTTKMKNPYLLAIESLTDASDGVLKINKCSLSFRKLFTKLVAELGSLEWSMLFQILVARNEAFRTYVLARTDTDTLIVPLLKKISMATALQIPSSFTHGHTGASGVRKHADGHKAASGLSYLTLVSEPSQQHQGYTSAWAMPSSPPLKPRNVSGPQTSASTAAASAVATATTGFSASTSGGSSNTAISAGTRLRQNSQLPSVLSIDTVPYMHLYLWMDVLLVLSSDMQFVEQLQRTTIDSWPATPTPLYKPPLTNCIVVESMRIFQLNLMLLKDSHLHNLSLGILVNTLGGSTGMPTAIAQKLIKLFEMIQKRYTKISEEMTEESEVYAHILSVFLALFCHLANTNNPQFIYGMLQAREILSAFRESTMSDQPSTGDDGLVKKAVQFAAELRVRIAYFHARISALPNPQQAKEILGLVESVAAHDHGKSNTGVGLTSRTPDDREWSAFMLPFVWELLLSSSIASVVVENKPSLLEQFENFVL